MAKHTTWKATSNLTSKATNVAEKAITSLGRWATTDHTGASKLQANLGWIDTLSVVLVTALCGFVGAVASAALFGLLLAWGLPMLFTL